MAKANRSDLFSLNPLRKINTSFFYTNSQKWEKLYMFLMIILTMRATRAQIGENPAVPYKNDTLFYAYL